MIPLISPEIPDPKEWVAYYRDSQNAQQYTNFGPCFDKASTALSYLTASRALPVSNGTTAITLALQTQFKRGDRILVPEFTVPATINAVLAAGMIPTVVPCDTKTWTLQRPEFSKNLYAGAIIVCPFGYAVDVEAYDAWAERCGLKLVYDFAGAWGYVPITKHPVTYSFHATKNFCIGEGGCILFETAEKRELARQLSNFGYDKNRMPVSPYGQNAKMDEVHCAMVIAQCKNIERIRARIEKKKTLIQKYNRALNEFGRFEMNSKVSDESAPSLCVFHFEDLGEVIERKMAERQITCKRYYYPTLSAIRAFDNYSAFPPTEYFKDCVALPCDVSEAEFEKIVYHLKEILLEMR